MKTVPVCVFNSNKLQRARVTNCVVTMRSAALTVSVADGDVCGVDGQCSVLLPTLHVGGDDHLQSVERPDRHHVHHAARQIRLAAVRHDQLHRAVLGASLSHHGALLSDRHDALAQQSRTGTALQDQRQCCCRQQQVSTTDTCVTRSVNSVQRDKLGQQIANLLVLSSCQFARGSVGNSARGNTARVPLSVFYSFKKSSLTEAIGVFSTQ